jgi:hypothetical protein
MRRDDLHERPALMMRLAHEPDVAEAEVAEAAVDELRRGRRRARAEVRAVDERDGEPGPGRVRRDTRPDDPAAVPVHQLWRRVSKRDRVPIYTVWAICVLAFLLVVPSLWFGYTGYVVATSIAVIGLYIAFVLPIILRLRAGESFERGAWHLGRHYKWIDWLAILWIAFISIVFFAPFSYSGIPWNTGFDWNVFNYTLLTVGGAFLLFGGWYVLSAKKWFKGPIRQGDEEELERIEAEYGAPALAPGGATAS